MSDKQQVQDEGYRKRRLRLAIIVAAHLLIVLTFFVSSFIWSKFT